MKLAAVSWCVAIVLVTLASVPVQSANRNRELTRGKRTIQHLVNHFAQFFRFSGPEKTHEKQDIAANPLKHLLMASTAQFSGGSKSKKPATTPKPFSGQYEIPSLPERLVQAESSVTSGPDRVALLESSTSTEAPTEEPTTESTSTTSEAPSEEPASEEPTTDPSPAEEESSSEPEQTTVDPTAVNGLVNDDAEKRDDNATQIEHNSIQTPSSFVNQQQHYFRRPVWNPFPYNQLPYTTYFGNNVFLPAPFIPQPFSHFGGYQQQQAAIPIGAASTTSHSRVKMHDQPYDLVTYHGDSVSAPSSYQRQVFGNRLPSSY
ncbi:AAEL009098-PA [Aedes aegypti]|uniref:AAEL009098-PA n=1 Tax=Aedes aegypti TaxID=7159 RepID=Q16WU0_AEDAE|nr:AAEL009098-PA [Aedes aegypti]